MGFVHLHCHSQFTILNGMPSPKKIIQTADEMGMSAVAMTDTCNLFGAVQFHKAAKGTGVKPIFGSEIWLWPEGVKSIPQVQKERRPRDGGWHLNFLVQNKVGYHNLSKLITEAIYYGMHFRPRIDLDLLETHAEGLLISTSGLNGPLGYALTQNDPIAEGKKILNRLGNIFGEDKLFLELQDYAIQNQPEFSPNSIRI